MENISLASLQKAQSSYLSHKLNFIFGDLLLTLFLNFRRENQSLSFGVRDSWPKQVWVEASDRMWQMVSNTCQNFIYTTYPHREDLAKPAQNHLRELPQPIIANPLAISPLSKLICSVFVWKTLVLLGTWRNRLRYG